MAKDKDGTTFDDTQHTSLYCETPTIGDEYTIVDLTSDDSDFPASSLSKPAGDFIDAQAADAAAEISGKAHRPDSRQMGAASKRLRAQGGARHLRNRASLDWRADQQRVCAPDGIAGGRLEKDGIVSLSTLTQTLLFSRTAAALYERLQAEGLSIIYDQQVPLSQYYPRAAGNGPAHTITLNPHHPKGDLINLLARELRRAWQYAEGALVNPLTFEPEEAILVNRAQQADVLMMSIKMAWELKLAGENEAWEYLVGSPMADVSRLFENKASADFRTLNNGEAARAAYDQFFESARTKLHDKRIIHQMLLDETGYIKSRVARPQVSMDLFRRLGQLPNGRNYLAMSGQQRLPTDPMYATIEDRANANFLWFIKFERSFQEKELQMVQESVKLSAEIVDMAAFAARTGRAKPRTRRAPSEQN